MYIHGKQINTGVISFNNPAKVEMYGHSRSVVTYNVLALNTFGFANVRVSSVLFFPISEKFLFFPFFLFFTEIPIFYFSAVFYDFHIFFPQKLKEAPEIRRISCSGKSHSCEIASL